MKRYRFKLLTLAMSAVTLASCLDDLNTEPLNERISTSASVFRDADAYKEFLAKLYGSLTLTGQRGEFGMPEIPNPDEGETSFMRMYWSAQEIPTDECIGAWANVGVIELRGTSWSAQNPYNQLLYQRVFINIAYCNEFIREAAARVGSLTAPQQEEVIRYITEARFLRALYYYYAMDLWGNVPFVTDQDDVGAYLPEQIKRADLFNYIEKELLEIIPGLAPPGTNEYARADQAAAWMLLAKMYLNAEVYTGTQRYTDCITYCNSILDAGVYSLHSNYDELFMTDNDRLTNEIILPISEDGNSTRSYGGMTFVIHAQVAADASMDPVGTFGIEGGWGGNRFRSAFVSKFADPTGDTDTRANFFATDRTLTIENQNEFSEGYSCTKFKNVSSTGVPGVHSTFVDTDFPLFRLADVYLMYAEAVKRGGGGGSESKALELINELRERAYGDETGNITASDLTLQFILDERARELYWEAHRRTDLIRYGQFTGEEYLWDWKGNVEAGTATDPSYNLFPIPATDLVTNTNLVQNDGY